jgi:hypothetical protein
MSSNFESKDVVVLGWRSYRPPEQTRQMLTRNGDPPPYSAELQLLGSTSAGLSIISGL